MRWMHVTPQISDLRSGDKYGVVSIVPAADKEVSNPTDAQWTPRMAVMQSTMIYVRNNPSAFFYEAGNGTVSDAQMADLKTLRDTWIQTVAAVLVIATRQTQEPKPLPIGMEQWKPTLRELPHQFDLPWRLHWVPGQGSHPRGRRFPR